ncbi:streptomycin biosynthesis protein [Actinoalloteichus sp. AHMU CJ021]|nr:streptomycin biosynthesis protein [Actinoalloteichus sp. AHMU CJ021]
MVARVERDASGGRPGEFEGLLSARGASVQVPITSLVKADSPRRTGEDTQHVKLLAESETQFPPIVVLYPSMRVIDGMHRLRAAELRGREMIDVRFYTGTERDAFVLAVQMNVEHGLPLSLADRTAAAARIVESHPMWSDRMTARVTGLAASTVRAIRQRSIDGSAQSNTRIGRDGRTRPLNTAAARRVASRLLLNHPQASLREIARASGLAPSTVQDVRRRLRAGENPVPPRQQGGLRKRGSSSRAPRERGANNSKEGVDTEAALTALDVLRRDPSLRFSDAGRMLLRWLDSQFASTSDWERLVEKVPPHCADLVVELAESSARRWEEFAAALRQRVDRDRNGAYSNSSG